MEEATVQLHDASEPMTVWRNVGSDTWTGEIFGQWDDDEDESPLPFTLPDEVVQECMI